MQVPLSVIAPRRERRWAPTLGTALLLSALVPGGAALAQAGRTVTGIITSQSGETLPGVTVIVKGTTIGATTNASGEYSLNVPEGSKTLVVSSIGYEKQEVPISASGTVSVKLVTEAQSLSEIQVVGYGVQKKSQVTGAISSVSEEQLRDVPVANVGQALQGRAAGVTIASNGTSPGQAPVIRIRGNRSFSGSNDPLLVVDGVPYDGSINDLNPDDLVSVEVLKDASSTAIYGARGANGVILISTRRGKSGAPKVNYSGYYGQKRAYGLFDLQNGEQYYNYKLEAYRARNAAYDPSTATFLTAEERANYAAGLTTDYQSLLFQHGHIQNHSLGISGGSDKTQYSVSLGLYDETGIVPVQRFKRYSLRGTLDQQVSNRIKIGVNTLNSFTDENDPNVNVLNQIITTSPLAPLYDANGNYRLYPNGDNAGANPLTLYAKDAHLDRRRRLRTFNSLYGQVNILKGLDYRLNVGLDARAQADDFFYASQTPNNGAGQNSAGSSSSVAYNILAENILTYNRTFKEKHDLNVTALYSRQLYHTDGFGATVRNTLADYQYNTNLSTGTPSTVNNPTQPIDWALESFMGRVNYSFDNRFSTTLTVRADGSSRLAPGNKTKAFPSAAVAWNAANESFLKDQQWLSVLKLRASLGRVGSTAINPYQTQGALSTGIGAGAYNFGPTTGAVGVVPATIANKDLTWEYTTTANVGLDFGFFDNRVTGSVEVYQQRTNNLLLPDALPTASGYGSFLRNAGETQNRGVEISLTTANVRPANPDGFEWSTDWNFTVNRERVLDLNIYNADGSVRDDVGNQRFIGQPLYVIYDYRKVGIWQLDEADQARRYGSKPGQIKVEDVNNDGAITSADRVVVGSRQPKFEAGLTNRFRFKGFDLSVVALTRVGATVVDPYSFGPSYYATNTGRRNQLNFNYWTATNPSNDYPQPDQTPRANEWPNYGSTLGYHSGTFIKVRSIDLGYTIPAAWAKAAYMSSARVYVQVQNPYIWAADKYFQRNKAIDPDALSYSSRFDSSQGVNAANISFQGGSNYPVTRSFIVGVNLGF